MKPLQRRPTLLGYEQPLVADPGGDSQRSQDHYAPRRKEWALDAEAIVKKLNSHEAFGLHEGFEITELPRFSDSMNYLVSDRKQFDLWAFEVRRLVGIVNDNKPIQLEGADEWFGAADREGYHRLDKLATQLIYATSICILDNELLLLEFCPAIANLGHVQASTRRLLHSFGPKGAVHTARGSILLDKENSRCYHALINYVTGTLVQVLLRTAKGDFWDDNVIISLSKLAAKLKVVSFDLERSASVCLAGKKAWESRLRYQIQNDFTVPADKEDLSFIEKQLVAAQRDVTHCGHRYFVIMDAFHQCINVLIVHIADELTADRNATAGPDSFEASSILYDTGLRRQRNMLCQQRSGAIGGSGSRTEIHCADFAFEVCLANLENLRASLEGRERQLVMGDTAPYTSVYWKWTGLLPAEGEPKGRGAWWRGRGATPEETLLLGKPRSGALQLASMKDVITALVPFVMLCGDFPCQLAGLVHSVHNISSPSDPTKTCEEVPFLASFVVRTSSHSSVTGPDVIPLSASPIARKRALAHWPSSDASQGNDPSSSSSTCSHQQGEHDGVDSDAVLHEELRKANARIARGMTLFDSWVVDENSIIIPYRKYCWGSLGLCGCLVVGGLAIGFTVEQRIQGVDPFNISVFCWVLAGFLTLVAKAVRVQEWPWRDFFLGRVVCRSVSEVVAVSWIDPQLLLSILLRLEPLMNLNKRGPFQTAFTRRSPDDGFDIDIPLDTVAMNDGGCFFVKVQGDTSPALMCVRTNYGAPFNSVEPQGYSMDGEEVKCRNLDTPRLWGKGLQQRRMYPLATNTLRWTRVVGLHHEEVYFN
ncbi:FAD dependent oxidoreductase [Purpureocillium lavendulum]|uniref:FAD dependent oxidoreductase n=1 Tax=Purpureocillium lavendulum TaxID=1247861 RepID=A0AB34FE04_9HYPO|nr:FAD dependent oxidoreductase [Purpureocillium lavendulum]